MRLLKGCIKGIFILIIVGILLLLYAIKVEPYLSVVKEHALNDGDSTERLRVIQVSDIQVNGNYTVENLMKLVKKINKLNADLFIFTGDLFENYSIYSEEEAVIKALSNIKVKYGKFAIWGNRDYGGGLGGKYEEILRKSNIQLLENSGENIELESGKTVFIGGLDDYLLGNPNIKPIINQWLDSNSYRILLTHEPDVADFYTAYDFNLILAGHSHGGQVKLPFIKTATSSMARKYISGFYRLESSFQTRLYVNQGIGTSHLPIRFLVPPEITLFDIGLK